MSKPYEKVKDALRDLELGPSEHALLFTSLVKATLSAFPSDGPRLVADAVKLYALERGRRMRQRALAAADGTTMASYRAYCEWTAPEGSLYSAIVSRSPVLVTRTIVCPWYEAWKKAGRLEEGRHYCAYVDEYLLRGFDESLRLGIVDAHSEGSGGVCEFTWHGVEYTQEAEEEHVRRRARVAQTGVMGWPYHMMHLISAFRRALEADGRIVSAVFGNAQDDFSELVSNEAALVFECYTDKTLTF